MARITEAALRRVASLYARRWFGHEAQHYRLIRATPSRGRDHRTHYLLVRYQNDAPQWETEIILGQTTAEACAWIWEHRNEKPHG